MAVTIARLLLREKPTMALLAVGELQPAYAALIAKRIDSTFPHTSGILSQLEEQGLIRSRSEGRIRYLELTDRGKRVVQVLGELFSLLQEPNEQWKKLEQIKQMAACGDAPGAALRQGPLRRDLAKLKDRGDEDLARAAAELDGLIAAAVGK